MNGVVPLRLYGVGDFHEETRRRFSIERSIQEQPVSTETGIENGLPVEPVTIQDGPIHPAFVPPDFPVVESQISVDPLVLGDRPQKHSGRKVARHLQLSHFRGKQSGAFDAQPLRFGLELRAQMSAVPERCNQA